MKPWQGLPLPRGTRGDGGIDGRILKPVSTAQEIIVEGRETERKGRNLFMAGEIRNKAGKFSQKGERVCW